VACEKNWWRPPPQASPLLGGERRYPGTWSRLIIPTASNDSVSIAMPSGTATTLVLRRGVGVSSSRVRLATPEMAHRNASPGRPFRPLTLRLPSPLRPSFLSPRCCAPPRVADTVKAVVVVVHCFAAGTRASGPRRLHPRALLRCSAVCQPGTPRGRGSAEGLRPSAAAAATSAAPRLQRTLRLDVTSDETGLVSPNPPEQPLTRPGGPEN